MPNSGRFGCEVESLVNVDAVAPWHLWLILLAVCSLCGQTIWRRHGAQEYTTQRVLMFICSLGEAMKKCMAWRSSKHPSQWYCWGVALCLSHAGVGMSLQRRLMWRQLLQLYCCRSCYCWWTCGFGWRNLDFSILITLDSGFSRNIVLYSYHGVTYPVHISSAAACKNNYFPDRLKMLIFLITYSKLSLIKWSWALMRKSNIPKYHFQIPLIPYHFRLIKINQNTSIIPVK